MSNVRHIARDWLPPAVTRWIRNNRGNDNRFEGEFTSWVEARARCTGYDTEEILAKVLAATLKVARGEAVYERDSVVFDTIEYVWPVSTGLLWAAARHAGRLSVLDFGGALGSSYFQNRGVLQALPSVCWSIVEQDHFVKAGRTHIQNNRLRFYSSIEECTAETRPNAILLSSVVQYLENPLAILSTLLQCGVDIVIVDRTIVNESGSDRIYVQHVPDSIYRASYPCRSLSESRLIAAFRQHYRLLGDFPSLAFPALRPIKSNFKGYLFERVCR
jgi:putative methyltransferase (TIGR04325 family)